MSNELSERDKTVIATIHQVRSEYHACTAAEVAARLKLSKAYLHEVMHDMISRGLVEFNAEMPGSVRVVADATVNDEIVDAPAHVCGECDWPTKQALMMHARKHA